jgi:hypothetical protein
MGCCFKASTVAAITGSGAVKSGSPICIWMMRLPSASNSLARFQISITWNGWISVILRASVMPQL